MSAERRELIQARLAALCARRGARLLFACESGSRAWGFPSPDSDYDVRFIYAHPLPWYLAVDEGRDVIEAALEDTPLGLLDLGGWDLRKTLRLARKSNPVVWEWLQSPIVYQALPPETLAEIRQVLDPFYSPIAACHHYLALCRGTMARELIAPTVKIKKYFYMLRPLLAALWIEQYRSVPPMEFAPLLGLLDGQADILAGIGELLERKRQTDERIPIPRVALIDGFLQRETARLREAAPNLPAASADIAPLNGLLRKLLGLPEA